MVISVTWWLFIVNCVQLSPMNASTNPAQISETITLGGGCFWCLDAVYVRVRGVLSVDSGYCNGHTLNPTYQDVCGGDTGHNEVVQLTFDASGITLTEILEIFFLVHDATTLNAQGNDVGTQYRSGIYFSTPEQEATAKAFIAQLTADKVFSRPIVTEVLPLQNYTKAEEYHQDFFAKNPNQGYCVAVAGPKVAKLRKTFADRVKS
jgi:peptide-methionine (S)-S-oxide reductase